LPYSNVFAYKELQKLKKGEYKWSKLVGAYVGPTTFAARGVPARFSNPKAERTPVVEPAVQTQASSSSLEGPAVVVKSDT